MSCTLEAPCANSVRRVVTLPTHVVYECLNGHSLVVGTPPRYASKYHQAQAERKACGYKGCKGLTSDRFTRCYRHRGKTRMPPGTECRGCGGTVDRPKAKMYCTACEERETRAREREDAIRASSLHTRPKLCLECDSPDHITPNCPIELATLVATGNR